VRIRQGQLRALKKGTRHFGRVRGPEKNRALSVNLDFVCPNSRRRETPNSGVIRGYIRLMAKTNPVLGSRRMTAMLHGRGLRINRKRVQD